MNIYDNAAFTSLYSGTIVTYSSLNREIALQSYDVALSGTSMVLYLSRMVTGPPSDDFYEPLTLTINFMSDCATTVIDPFTIPDI